MREAFIVVAMLSSTLVGQERARPVQIDFTASAESFLPATKEYGEIWASEGPRIVAAMERATGLRFEPGPIGAIIYEGASFLRLPRAPDAASRELPVGDKAFRPPLHHLSVRVRRVGGTVGSIVCR